MVNVPKESGCKSGAVPLSVFPATIEFAIVNDGFVNKLSAKTPPPTPVVAALPVKVLLVKLTPYILRNKKMPPPSAPSPDVLLPLKVLLVKLTEPKPV